jgi:hypothetical protein
MDQFDFDRLLGVSRCSFKDSISAGPPPTHRSDVTYRVSMYHAQLRYGTVNAQQNHQVDHIHMLSRKLCCIEYGIGVLTEVMLPIYN